MAKKLNTPGVYTNETGTVASSIPPIATAVPAWIGYTEKAAKGGKPLNSLPLKISSIAEYEMIFGGPAASGLKKGVVKTPAATGSDHRFFLFPSLELYFANGGTACYIVSIGNYDVRPAATDFLKGITALETEQEPTLLLAPDAMLLAAPGCFQVQQQMLNHCAAFPNRFAILDIPDGFQARTGDADDVIDIFRKNINQNLSRGAAYYPWVYTNIQAGKASGLLPPSGAIAGVYCATDQQFGVFKAPANVALSRVTALSVPISDAQQEDLNVPTDGKAVNAIRNFPGHGNMVWGARTLDGNSNEWRYISVRRTVMYIEQSIKNTLNQFVFSANDGTTWATVVATINNFLAGLWQQGGLLGAQAKDAFGVQVGLGITMTQQDITNGFMRVNVLVAPVRPAEFIVLTFQQEMAT